MDPAQALVVRTMSMTFGGQRALDAVDVSIRRGEIHGLVGQNGCGKSTLIKILSGYHHPDPGGELEIDGRPVKLPVRTGSASELGMSFVHQDLGLLPTLTVVENFRAWTISTKFELLIRWGRERQLTEEAFARYGLSCDPRAVVGELPAVQRALLAIVRALEDLREYTKDDESRGGLLVLDEPTVFLPRENRENLFEVIRRSVTHGSSVLFVSHDLDEALAVTDRITVLRDGRVEGTVSSAETNKDQLVEMIIGKRLEAFEASHRAHTIADQGHLSVDGVSGGTIKNVSFAMKEGEVLGLTGLVGSGFEEILYQMFGATRAQSGRMTIAGVAHDLAAMSPPAAIKAGMALIPADRQGSAGVGSLLVRDNVMLQVIDQYRPYRLDRRRYLRGAEKALKEYDVRPPEPLMDFQALSGGNQQKVVISKWLMLKPKILIMDEPTRGVDVGAKTEIYSLMRQLVGAEVSIIMISSELPELLAMSDRVVCIAEGHVAGILDRSEATPERVMRYCTVQRKQSSEKVAVQ